MKRFRVAIGMLAVAALLLFTGARTIAVQQYAVGGETIWAFSRWSVVSSAAPALLAVVAALLMVSAKIGLLRLFAALPTILGLVLASGAYDTATSRVAIGQSTLTLPSRGFPLRAEENLALSQISGVIVRQNAGDIEFVMNDARHVHIPIGTLVRAARGRIIEELESREIPVAEFD